MKKLILSVIVLVVTSISTNIVFAGSLDKYGGSSRYKSAPITKSPRDEAVEKAVRILNSKTDKERNDLIVKYQQRIDKAVKAKQYDEAEFYTDILRRAGSN